MSIQEVYPNPTVKQVIFQIRYPNLFFIEKMIPDIQMAIMDKFPESSLSINQQITFSQLGSEAKIEKISGENDAINKVWNFRSQNNYELVITSNSLSISSAFYKTYNSDSSDVKFREIIIFVLDNFFKFIKLPYVLRVGLRYIDECPLFKKTSENLKNNFDSSFPVDRFPMEQAEEMAFRVVTKRENHKLIYAESLATNDKKDPVIILDFDGYEDKVLIENVLQTTDELHRIISDEYKHTIKQPIIDYMKGVYNGD